MEFVLSVPVLLPYLFFSLPSLENPCLISVCSVMAFLLLQWQCRIDNRTSPGTAGLESGRRAFLGMCDVIDILGLPVESPVKSHRSLMSGVVNFIFEECEHWIALEVRWIRVGQQPHLPLWPHPQLQEPPLGPQPTLRVDSAGTTADFVFCIYHHPHEIVSFCSFFFVHP